MRYTTELFIWTTQYRVQPAYNVQFATDVHGRAIVGVDVVNTGSDAQQSQPMREQVERRSGCKRGVWASRPR